MGRAVLKERRAVGGGLTLIGLDVEAALAAGYVAPGQYVQVKTPLGNGYFVLANDVGATRWELLVRNSGEASLFVLEAPLDTELEISSALGDGFPLDRARTRRLVVAVVVGALGLARPVLRQRIDTNEAALTTILVGVRHPRDLPLAEEVSSWHASGAHVVLCVSTEHDDPTILPGIPRERGYVQAVLGRLLLADAFVVAAGPKPMLTEIRALATPTLEVFTNH